MRFFQSLFLSIAKITTTAVAAVALGCSAGSVEKSEPVGAIGQPLEAFGFGLTQIPNGTFTSAPSVTSRGAGSVDVFARGGDNQIWSSYWSTPTGWLGWSALGGGTFSSKPSATSVGPRLFVAAKGMDNKIYVKPYQGSPAAWGAWATATTSTFDTAPAIAYAAPYLYLLARKSDQTIYWSRNDVSVTYNSAAWSAFAAIPNGSSAAEPAVAFDGFNLRVVVRRSDNKLWTAKQNGAGWSSWSAVPLAGAISATTFKYGPAISSWGSGHIDVFATGSDDRIYFASQEASGSWNTLRVIPTATFMSSPSAWSNMGAANQVSLTAEAMDATIYYSAYNRPCPVNACPDVVSDQALSLWPGGNIYYSFKDNVDVPWVRKAMDDWQNVTNQAVRFIHSTTVVPRLTIFANQTNPVTGSYYGHSYADCVQFPPNHATPCGVWLDPNLAYHELGHSIGLIHHWARYDRRHYMRLNFTDCSGVQGRTLGAHDFGPFDFKSALHYGATFPDHTRWDNGPLCGGQTCSDQACVGTSPPGCPGGLRCPTCTECTAQQPAGFPTPGDASTVVEAYTNSSNSRWKKFKRAVNEDTGAGAFQPFDYTIASGVTIGANRSLAAAAYPNGSIDLYVTGSDSHVCEKTKNGSSFTTWRDLGALPGSGAVSDPAAVSWGAGRVDIAVRRGSTLYIKSWTTAGGYTSWQSLGTPGSSPASAPAIASWGPNRLDVFVRGTNDQLYWKKCTANCSGSAGTWSGWSAIAGGTFRGKPTAVGREVGVVDVFMHGMDDKLWGVELMNDSWGGFYLATAAGSLKWDANCPDCSSPAVMSRGAGKLDVLIRGQDDQMWVTSWASPAPAWGGYSAVGGVITSSPTGIARARSTDRIDTFAVMPEERAAGSLTYGPWWKEYTE